MKERWTTTEKRMRSVQLADKRNEDAQLRALMRRQARFRGKDPLSLEATSPLTAKWLKADE